MASTKPARGMRDFLPADVRKRNYVINIIKEVYESYGFEPLETPAVENIETLMGKYGDEGNQLIFRVLKRGDKLDKDLKALRETGIMPGSVLGERITPEGRFADLALRYDLTVPLARVVANHKNDLPKFFKRYQIQPVWRADRPALGRFREFYQCDVDAIGSNSMVVEAELISAVSEILRRLGFEDFVIRVNSRKLLTEILDVAGVPKNKHIDALISLDKLDKIGREAVAKEFVERGVSSDSSEKLLLFLESLVESDFKNTLGKIPTKRLIQLKKRLIEKEEILAIPRKRIENLEQISRDFDAAIENIQQQLDKLDSPRGDTDTLKQSASRISYLAKQGGERIRMMENFHKFIALLKFLSGDSDFESPAVDELTALFDPFRLKLLDTSDPSAIYDPIVLDPTLARGLSYYTGTIMEINVPKFAGSLGGGGRYDGLIGMFGKEQIPACGFSLGLERILVVMEERGMFPPEIAESTAADVMVTIWSDETIPASLKLAADLRKQGVRVTVYPEVDKLGKQIKYADSIGVPWVCVLGESEIAERKVTLKNMRSGEQHTIAVKDIASKIAE
jgi:histidyl-tRNA synthetase